MTILGIPNVVVREAVDVRVQATIGVHVDVRDENVRQTISATTHRILSGLNLMPDIEVRRFVAPTDYFLVRAYISTLLQDVSGRIPEYLSARS